MLIRDAREDDLPGILAIYNHVIAHTTAVYTDTPAPLADREAWFEARRAGGFRCWSRTMAASSALRASATSVPGRATRARSSIRCMSRRTRAAAASAPRWWRG